MVKVVYVFDQEPLREPSSFFSRHLAILFRKYSIFSDGDGNWRAVTVIDVFSLVIDYEKINILPMRTLFREGNEMSRG